MSTARHLLDSLLSEAPYPAGARVRPPEQRQQAKALRNPGLEQHAADVRAGHADTAVPRPKPKKKLNSKVQAYADHAMGRGIKSEWDKDNVGPIRELGNNLASRADAMKVQKLKAVSGQDLVVVLRGPDGNGLYFELHGRMFFDGNLGALQDAEGHTLLTFITKRVAEVDDSLPEEIFIYLKVSDGPWSGSSMGGPRADA